MYVMTCAGGYPVPMKGGRFEIMGFSASVLTPASAARVTLVDDAGLDDYAKVGRILPDSTSYPVVIADLRTAAAESGRLEVMFPEPIKTRHGVSLSGYSNIEPGTGMLYVR